MASTTPRKKPSRQIIQSAASRPIAKTHTLEGHKCKIWQTLLWHRLRYRAVQVVIWSEYLHTSR
jgi:hypothetical protein